MTVYKLTRWISITLILAVLPGAVTSLEAGVRPWNSPPATSSETGNWCEWLGGKPGLLYQNADNPILQSFQIGGRFQYQAAYIEGEDVNSRDFNDTYDEYRRARLETKFGFLRYFGADVKVNMVNDGRLTGSDLDWGYDTFDEAIFSFDIKKAFGAGRLDTLKLNYGRFKFLMTEEAHMSSKEIYTIERSANSNKLFASINRPTGVTLEVGAGKWEGTLGVFSGEDDSEFIGGWNDGEAYYFSISNQISDEWRMLVDFVINNESGEDDFLGYAWAAAASAVYEKDRFGTVSTLAIGENNDNGIRGGSFHSLMVMPFYWIVEERLQGVFQYQFAGAGEGEGIRANLRYLRSQHSPGVNVNSGYGDELHTLYAGLNYHFCGDNLKVMGGIEYASLETPAGDVTALTYLIGFRTFF